MFCLTEYLAFFLEWPVHSGMYYVILSYVIQPFKNEKVMFYLKVKSYLTVNTIWLGYKNQ
jgi:hypothetical protein